MSQQTTSTEHKNEHKKAHIPGVDAMSPFHAWVGFMQKESARVLEESEKAMERSMHESERAMREGQRVLEAQMHASQAFTRAMYEGARRMMMV